MKYLLDTNITSEPTRPKPDPAVMAWLEKNQSDCAISTISLAEIRFGIERLPEGKRKNHLDKQFRFLLEDLSEAILPFDVLEAAEWARYAALLEKRMGQGWFEQIDLRDTMIAAVARTHELIIVTRNIRDFPETKLINPFGQ